jgi:hypothetical protein
MSKPRPPDHEEIIQAQNELDLKLMELIRVYKLTEIELLAMLHGEMAFPIKHIREKAR